MPKYRILLFVEGSNEFTIETTDKDAAWEKAQRMLSDGTWDSERERLNYGIADVTEVE